MNELELLCYINRNYGQDLNNHRYIDKKVMFNAVVGGCYIPQRIALTQSDYSVAKFIKHWHDRVSEDINNDEVMEHLSAILERYNEETFIDANDEKLPEFHYSMGTWPIYEALIHPLYKDIVLLLLRNGARMDERFLPIIAVSDPSIRDILIGRLKEVTTIYNQRAKGEITKRN